MIPYSIRESLHEICDFLQNLIDGLLVVRYNIQELLTVTVSGYTVSEGGISNGKDSR